MDKNALRDKRRETVIGLLKEMDIKQNAAEGFDKEDVYAKVQELCTLYEEHIDELERNYDAEISTLTKRYQKYDENNELYVSLIMEAKKSSNEIINQAKEEVDDILSKGREQVALQEQQLEQFKADSARERAEIEASLRAKKEAADTEKAAMRVEVEAEKERLEAVKNKYRQLIISMEDEFAEIRTNILRTSARLDSLKAQAEEITPETEWEVKTSTIEVEQPTADLEVENILDTESKPQTTMEPVKEEDFVETFFKSEILQQIPKAEPAEPVATPVIEPAAEPVIEPVIEPVAEPAIEPIVESIAEPIIEPAVEEEPEVTVEELLANIEIAEPEDIQIPEAEPAIEIKPAMAVDPVELEDVFEEVAPQVEEPSPAEDVDALLEEISFDDVLTSDTGTEGGEIEGIEEISLEELEAIEAELNQSEDTGEEKLAEEISFEGLEELFKDK